MNFSNKVKDKIKMFGNAIDQARYFLDESPMYFDETGSWWIWNDVEYKYEMVDEISVCNLISECIPDDVLIKNQLRNELLFSIKMESRRRKPLDFEKTWIQFKDKIYDYEKGTIFNAEPIYFNTNPVPHVIGNSTDTPIIDKLFNEWVGAEFVTTLKEVCAFSLVQDYFLHRIICLTGSGCNGKGRFIAFLQKLLGETNCCSSELDSLIKSSFGTSDLYKKLLCLMGETDFGVLSATGRIKSLSGQDPINAQFKNKNAFKFYNYAKIIIATNTIPATTDKTDGFYRRWLIIDFPNKFKEGNDPLDLISEEEYCNFLRQLFPMVINLRKRGMFTNDGDIEHRKARYEAKSNPFAKFIKENYKKSDVNSYVEVYDMFNSFEIYLQERGLRKITYNEFKKLFASESLEMDEDKEYKDIYNKETGKFDRKQVRVKRLYGYSILPVKTNKTDKTEISYQGTYRDKYNSVSVLSCLSQNDKISISLVEQYIKEDIKKEYFVSDFCNLNCSDTEIKEILSCLVARGDLIETPEKGWKVVAK